MSEDEADDNADAEGAVAGGSDDEVTNEPAAKEAGDENSEPKRRHPFAARSLLGPWKAAGREAMKAYPAKRAKEKADEKRTRDRLERAVEQHEAHAVKTAAMLEELVRAAEEEGPLDDEEPWMAAYDKMVAEKGSEMEDA